MRNSFASGHDATFELRLRHTGRRVDSGHAALNELGLHGGQQTVDTIQNQKPNEPPPTGVRKLLFGPNPKRTITRVVVLVVVTFVTFKYVLLPIRVSGVSMFPAYKDGQILLINRLAFSRSHPQRFDVVAVRIVGFHTVLLKRIIGVPGETVAIRRGDVFINGQKLQEDYVKARLPWHEEPAKLGPDEYLVIGDNRAMSQTDHDHGICVRKQILGKVLF